MKYIGLFIIGLLVGVSAIFMFSILKTQESPPLRQKPIPTPASTFSIETPPSESLKGSITKRSGILFFESRTATAPAQLNDSVPIQQGEKLIAKEEGSATVNFDRVGSMMLLENADLAFIQTLPVDFVVEQKKGTVKYIITGEIPFSIRIRNALLTKTTGSIEITMEDEDPVITISTFQGQALIGFNDLDYISQVFTLNEGQIYEYDSDERTAINIKNK